MALDYSEEHGFLSKDSHKVAKEILKGFQYDFTDIKLDANGIFEAMKSDKKNTDGINLVLLKEIGQPFIFEEPSNENLKNFIIKFINDFEE